MQNATRATGSGRRAVLGLMGTAALLAGPAMAQSPGSSGASGPLKSAGAMSFGSDNVLFVGDIAGAAVHAFALRPAT